MWRRVRFVCGPALIAVLTRWTKKLLCSELLTVEKWRQTRPSCCPVCSDERHCIIPQWHLSTDEPSFPLKEKLLCYAHLAPQAFLSSSLSAFHTTKTANSTHGPFVSVLFYLLELMCQWCFLLFWSPWFKLDDMFGKIWWILNLKFECQLH